MHKLILKHWNAFPGCKAFKAPDAFKTTYAHGKRDGWRIGLVTDKDGRTRALTRGFEEIEGIVPAEYVERAKPLSLVWVEAWEPGKRAVKPRPGCRLTLIAAPLMNGENWTTNFDDATIVLSTVESMSGEALKLEHLIALDDHLAERLPTAKSWLDEAERLGLEGWVFKHGHYEGWWKLKPKPTIRLRVAEIIGGKTGKRIGGAGSLACALDDADKTVVCHCSGMTEEVRASLSAADVGRVCEVEYQCVGARGGLRHPQFKRWRDDVQTAATSLP